MLCPTTLHIWEDEGKKEGREEVEEGKEVKGEEGMQQRRKWEE